MPGTAYTTKSLPSDGLCSNGGEEWRVYMVNWTQNTVYNLQWRKTKAGGKG